MFVSFLTDRDQFTNVGDKRSFTRIIMPSIIQGFRTYIIYCIYYDLQPIGHSNHLTKYADDCSLLVPEKSDVGR